ncbi:unnamed protein product [Didymodactylos carnosus]|uniref:Uncharacterized protein n=1 Tax=Didymodactylos carnosus TaxID=1234261 RepID=A0A815AAX9_9BILA|nr:unnamed protein product [Didymodactylos carnosus]CAF1254900.1 unnamed protein product [Didymodactylos carnosus]CAF4026441.1 unnamed protein product [Didymodactylos carnosus]CAF4032328.1 unnamed protein product [Didymodactylos carnosus]
MLNISSSQQHHKPNYAGTLNQNIMHMKRDMSNNDNVEQMLSNHLAKINQRLSDFESRILTQFYELEKKIDKQDERICDIEHLIYDACMPSILLTNDVAFQSTRHHPTKQELTKYINFIQKAVDNRERSKKRATRLLSSTSNFLPQNDNEQV